MKIIAKPAADIANFLLILMSFSMAYYFALQKILNNSSRKMARRIAKIDLNSMRLQDV